MKNKKVYISGKITGLDIEEAESNFREAELKLKSEGYTPVNPMTIEHDHDKSWESYMRNDIKALMDCDYIYLLSNHQQSAGATIERDIALKVGIKIFPSDWLK